MIRFTNDELLKDAEAVARSIAKTIMDLKKTAEGLKDTIKLEDNPLSEIKPELLSPFYSVTIGAFALYGSSDVKINYFIHLEKMPYLVSPDI